MKLEPTCAPGGPVNVYSESLVEERRRNSWSCPRIKSRPFLQTWHGRKLPQFRKHSLLHTTLSSHRQDCSWVKLCSYTRQDPAWVLRQFSLPEQQELRSLAHLGRTGNSNARVNTDLTVLLFCRTILPCW